MTARFMHVLRQALRPLRRHPAFTLAAVLTLALGIGANTAIFSVIYAVLLRPFPYPDSGGIMFVAAAQRDRPESTFPVNLADLQDFQKESRVFASLGGALDAQFTVRTDEGASRLKGSFVSPSTLELLRVPPVRGRLFVGADDQPGAPRTCILSHRAWERFFGSAPDVVGRTVVLNEEPHEIVGVMPPEFKFWDAWFYVPLAHGMPAELRPLRGVRIGLWGIGRLAPGVTPEQAQEALDVIARRLEAAYPAENSNTTVKVNPLAASVGGRLRPTLLLLFAAVGCVLLIACVNVTNLMLARGASRVRELAVRSALGASRARLAGQLLLETLPVGVLSAALGVALAVGGLRVLLQLIPADLLPAESSVGLSWPVLLFTLAAGLFTAAAAGALPAWQGSRAAMAASLKDGGRAGTGLAGTRVRAALVVAETALALALLVSAGLLIRNLASIARTDPGFPVDRLLVAAIELPEQKYRDPEQGIAFTRDLAERLARFPEVRQLGFITSPPLYGGSLNLPFLVEGRPFNRDELFSSSYNAVTPGALETLGLKLERGRTFTEADHAQGERVVIINAAAARRFFPNEDPLGRRITCGIPAEMAGPNPAGMVRAMTDPPYARIVGIVADHRQYGLTIDTQPETFFPLAQSLPVAPVRNNFSLIVRTAADPAHLMPVVRKEIMALDPGLPVDRLRTMERIIFDGLSASRFVVLLLGAFAGVALVLAAIGIYSVVAWLVAQRTREMGIRVALGAEPGRVVSLVLRQGLRPVLIGLVAGVGLALLVTRLLASQLVNTPRTDPLTYLLVSLLLTAVAAAACWIPARRAARADPLTALRQD